MYIIYTNNGKYASAAVSKRNGKKTSVSYTYLGAVVDKKKGIYQNNERGVFTFDPKTQTYGSVPESYVPAKTKDRRKNERIILDFGDVFFTNAFLYKSGLMEVVDSIGYGNPDTLRTMLLFYILSSLPNYNAQIWYEGSIVKLLYPKANLTSQRISDFLRSIGNPEKLLRFQKSYIEFITKSFDPDQNILIDSSGLPNGIHMPLTAVNNHNGKVSNEVRLVFVVQKSTGLPLYFQAVPGNLVDATTLKNILLHVEALGINVGSCIIDAGYNTGPNLDVFYDESNVCRIGYITRVNGNDREFTGMIRDELSTIDQKENFVKYGDRYLFIKKKKILVGSNKDHPAWLYLGLDCSRVTDESKKLWKRAFKNRMSLDEVFSSMQKEGVFGVISGTDYSCEDILPAYYQRQSAEQIFDFAKNYTKLLPLRTHSEETFHGHLLLAYIASCAVKMMHLKLKSTDLILGSRLACMRNQKCTVYEKNVVIGYPQKEANDTYKTFHIPSPDSIPMINGILQYTPPAKSTVSFVSVKEVKSSELSDRPTSKQIEAPKKTTDTVADAKNTVQKKDTSSGKNRTSDPNMAVNEKRHTRGRPPGSKNKSTLEKERFLSEAIANGTAFPEMKRGKGRPPGSKNKSTLEKEKALEEAIARGEVSPPPKKRTRGRPAGSKNKPKMDK